MRKFTATPFRCVPPYSKIEYILRDHIWPEIIVSVILYYKQQTFTSSTRSNLTSSYLHSKFSIWPHIVSTVDWEGAIADWVNVSLHDCDLCVSTGAEWGPLGRSAGEDEEDGQNCLHTCQTMLSETQPLHPSLLMPSFILAAPLPPFSLPALCSIP